MVELKKATKLKEEEKRKKSKSVVSSPELKTVRVEDLNTLSAGIDAYIKEQLNRDWLGEVS